MSSENSISEKEEKEHHIQEFNKWNATIDEQLPKLSKPQATVLALWSFGIIIVRSCSISAVKLILAGLFDIKENTIRQRLKEFYLDSNDKKGQKRTQVNVRECFVFILKWIIKHWKTKQIALAMDATTLGLSFTVLAISVLYRGCSIPIAWTITKGNEEGEWNKEWIDMLSLLRPAIPDDYAVIVATDRGLYSPVLFRYITKMKWHPFMRINKGGTFRPKGHKDFRPISSFANQSKTHWQGIGTAFKSKPLDCTLLAYWEEGQDEAWFILTDLPPDVSNACWYGMRAWIEHGFKHTKREGLGWHRTRMESPTRAERVWLAMSLATFYIVIIGGEVDASICESTFPRIHCAAKSNAIKPNRKVSIFRLGWITVILSLIRHKPLRIGCFIPEQWTESPYEIMIHKDTYP
jgi:hypothetical protein